jgi:hypothetical protein
MPAIYDFGEVLRGLDARIILCAPVDKLPFELASLRRKIPLPRIIPARQEPTNDTGKQEPDYDSR